MPDPAIAPADAAERERALDIRRSIIVQAPAGSGKTDLLTRRFLRLLAVVGEPEEILAITFTRAATAEMRGRILSDLEAAARGTARADDEERMSLARAALAQSERRGWNLLHHPQRLAIETIDSLCLRIAHDRPLLARLGGHLQPTEHAEPLYALAARRTIEHLGSADRELDAALAHFLDLRDNRLSDCEALLAKMLATRDQWQHVLPLSRSTMTENDWETARVLLQAPFSREVRRLLAEAHRLLAREPLLSRELLALANYACSNGNENVAALTGIFELSPSFSVGHWRCLCNLLLTKEREWRKAVTVKEGFPPEKTHGPEAKRAKKQMEFLLTRLRDLPGFLDVLHAVRDLPQETYSGAQWTTLRHILTVLYHAIGELRVVFAEAISVDFTEISLAALEVLKDAPDRAAGLGAATRHLLIDEFQDTSRRQHELVTELLRAWDPGEGRTVFLVGDPMQSIYMFRQAEVDIFHEVCEHGIGPAENRVPCETVRLSVNFRSHSGLTTPLNEFFEAIGAEPPPPGAAPANFVPATSADPAERESAVHVYPQIVGNAMARPSLEECREAQREEARKVADVIASHMPQIDHARATGGEYRVAILVRARTHLAEIVPQLRKRGIPYRAVEIERLSDRQELLDLRSLTRALLHPMDRIAWLSVLRAPWCGLTLADLHRLTGSDHPTGRDASILELADRHLPRLSPDGQRRLTRTVTILRRALDLRWRQAESPSFASWIERTWRTLGGAACVDAAGAENAEVFFSLLDSVTPDGLAPLTAEFDAGLERLFAQPDPSVDERCGVHLMTIHKAKGLGFDAVVVPGLERKPFTSDQDLLCSLERRNPFDPAQDEFLVVPIGAKGEDADATYNWVRQQRKIRFDEERKRLFYVACTRARRELHLLGTATLGASGLSTGAQDSLLATAWPALHGAFEEASARRQAATPAARVLPFPEPAARPGMLEELAAAADSSPKPRRLTAGFEPHQAQANVSFAGAAWSGSSDAPEFRRPEGSRLARVIGSAMHELLQRLGSQLGQLPPDQLRAPAAALLRASALTGEALESTRETLLRMLQDCAADPICRWILAPHPDAQSEAAWSGFAPGSRLRTLRADRVFRAGPEPHATGSEYLWVIDYKTGSEAAGSHADRDALLAKHHALYAPQLMAYARALRALHGPDTRLRLGLYYPALAAFDFWEPGF
ncbi:MAG TPA: UvrD-helicase domain-containing protein [Acidobacteriaceae bacterium]